MLDLGKTQVEVVASFAEATQNRVASFILDIFAAKSHRSSLGSQDVSMFDSDATLTQDEILERFKKLFNREMTPAEKRGFFLVESSDHLDTDHKSKAAKG
jgi:hypothetical protein